MRLVVITDEELRVYEDKRLLSIFFVEGEYTAKDVEDIRTANYDERA